MSGCGPPWTAGSTASCSPTAWPGRCGPRTRRSICAAPRRWWSRAPRPTCAGRWALRARSACRSRRAAPAPRWRARPPRRAWPSMSPPSTRSWPTTPPRARAPWQPGAIQGELNARVAPDALVFGADTSTSDVATLGGMVGNNSAGMRSLVYGTTADQVVGLRCVLAGGETVELRPLPRAEAERRARGEDAEAAAAALRPGAGRSATATRSAAATRRSCGGCRATAWTRSSTPTSST